MKALTVALPVVLLLAGCSMSQNIVLNSDGSGIADVHVHLGPLIVRYLDEILGSLGVGPETSNGGKPVLFDQARVRRTFTKLPGVKLERLSTPSRDTLSLRLSFSNLNRVIPVEPQNGGLGTAQTGSGGNGQSTAIPPIEFTTQGNVKTLRVELSRATWPAVASLPPLQEDPLLATLGLQGGKPYTEAEYLNLLEYAFADFASKAQVRAALEDAMVTVTITVQGRLISQSGGEREGNSVVYRIPLLRIVTLEKPIDLSLSFE